MNRPEFQDIVLDYFLAFRKPCSLDQLEEHSGVGIGRLREMSWAHCDNVNRGKIGNCWYYSPAAHYVVEKLAQARAQSGQTTGELRCA